MTKIKDYQAEKERLIENSQRYKEDFEQEFSDLTGRVERGIITGLIAGGLAYVTYKIYRKLTEDNSEEEESKEDSRESKGDSSLAKVGQYVAQTMALILINVAKEKLIEYLNEKKDDQDGDLPEDH